MQLDGTSRVGAGGGVGASGDATLPKPRLVFFHSERSGPSRRVEGFLAQVLQRRGNHDTFKLHRIATDERPDIAGRFAVDEIPTLIVVEGNHLRGRLRTPRGCDEIERFLSPWLK